MFHSIQCSAFTLWRMEENLLQCASCIDHYLRSTVQFKPTWAKAIFKQPWTKPNHWLDMPAGTEKMLLRNSCVCSESSNYLFIANKWHSAHSHRVVLSASNAECYMALILIVLFWNFVHSYGFAFTTILESIWSWMPIIEPISEQSLRGQAAYPRENQYQ